MGNPRLKSFRTWLLVFTLAMIAILVVSVWHEVQGVIEHLAHANYWVLALLIPVQCISYLSTGESMFSYLRSRGQLKGVRTTSAMRMSLEFNFLNHIVPSGGAAGLSFLSWKLGFFRVSPGDSIMAQLVRFVASFASYILLLLVVITWKAFSDTLAAPELVISAALTLIAGAAIALITLTIRNEKLVLGLIDRAVHRTNALFRRVPLIRKNVLKIDQAHRFAHDIGGAYTELRANPKALILPFAWSLIFNLADVALFYITFSSIGVEVNFGTLLIAYGISTICSIIVITPGGTGLYELLMVSILTLGGVTAADAIAGTIITRAILLLGTIVFGYAFYHHTILKLGKNTHHENILTAVIQRTPPTKPSRPTPPAAP
jgi:putative heme transporter